MTERDDRPKPETRAAQALGHVDDVTGAIVPPLHSSTTFARDAANDLIGSHIYSREGSPTIDLAEDVIASLDEGAGAWLFASGLAATAALVQTVPPGGRVVAPRIMYHGAQDWLRRLAAEGRIMLELFDETDPSSLEATIGGAPIDLVWIETPVNPTWDVIDIAAAARTAHDAGALLAVDSTCAPPPTTRPLLLGADFVFHSATKYLNGHSDLTAGVLVARDAGSARWRDVAKVRTLSGGTLGAFEAWLLIRGLRTLYVRFARQCETAMALARHLEAHPAIERVLYPGLASHPGHGVASLQMTGGFGGMLSVLVAGDAEAARRVAAATRLLATATSLGGVESLIEHRRSVQSPETRVAGNLLRISVGLEAPDDLVADIERALKAI